MLLAVENRESEDPRTLGELFIYFIDELADITFAQAFSQVMEMFRAEMKDRFNLDESTMFELIIANSIISTLSGSALTQFSDTRQIYSSEIWRSAYIVRVSPCFMTFNQGTK